MTLQPLHQLPNAPNLPLHALEPLPDLHLPLPRLQLPQFLPLVLQQRLQLPLHQRRFTLILSPPPAPPSPTLLLRFDTLDLILQLLQLPLQPYLLPVLRYVRFTEVGPRRRIPPLPPCAQPREIRFPKLRFPACARGGIRMRRTHPIDIIIDTLLFKASTQTTRYGPRNPKPLMPLIQYVQKRQRGMFPHALLLPRIDEVPRAADIGVWDVEARVEGFEGGEGERAVRRFVGVVDGFVFRFVAGSHVPVEVVF